MRTASAYAAVARFEPQVIRATPSSSSSAGGGVSGLGDHVDRALDPMHERVDRVDRRKDRIDAVRTRGEVRVAALRGLGDVAAADADEDVDARVDHEVGNGLPDRADRCDLLVDVDEPRAGRVLEVDPDEPRVPRGARGADGIAVAALEIAGHGNVDRLRDPPRGLDHHGAGCALAVLEPERPRDGGARRRERPAAVERRERLRARDVPRVRQHEDRRLHVHPPERLCLLVLVHAASLRMCCGIGGIGPDVRGAHAERRRRRVLLDRVRDPAGRPADGEDRLASPAD